jgi:hypothetical protein
MQDLTQLAKSELEAKKAPGPILNQIFEAKLREIAKRYPHNKNALWIGSYLADIMIQDAKEKGDLNQHVPMALSHAEGFITKHGISDQDAEIIREVVATHHGGEQKHIESKLFKNADCFKFLNPRGVFHIFSAFYTEPTPEKFAEAMQYTMFKVEEKYRLVDLDDELKKEAQELYDRWQWFFNQTDVASSVPSLYQPK